VSHGVVDVFAFQEALFIEALFGVVLLAMIWAGFRRWLLYKEKHDARLESVEKRLNALEHIRPEAPVPHSMLKGEELRSNP